MGDISAAIDNVTKLIKFYPTLADAYIFRAKLHRLIDDCFACCADLVKTRQHDPNHPEIHDLFGKSTLMKSTYCQTL
jgi:hypothetical protein